MDELIVIDAGADEKTTDQSDKHMSSDTSEVLKKRKDVSTHAGKYIPSRRGYATIWVRKIDKKRKPPLYDSSNKKNEEMSNCGTDGSEVASSFVKNETQHATLPPHHLKNGIMSEQLSNSNLLQRTESGENQVSLSSIQPLPGAFAVQGIGIRSNNNSRVRASSVQSSPQHRETIKIVATAVEDQEDTVLPTIYPIDVITGEAMMKKKRKRAFLFGLLVCSLVGLVVGLVMALVGKNNHTSIPSINTNDGNTTAHSTSTLETVVQRGFVRCGVSEKYDFTYQISADFCKAIAAAIFGLGTINSVELSQISSLGPLANKEVDVITDAWIHTMEREVYLENEKTGFSFTDSGIYSGLIFGGIPPFGECAATQNTHGDCSELRVCISSGSIFIDIVREMLPEENIRVVTTESQLGIFNFLNPSDCNAIAANFIMASGAVAELAGYEGEYEVGNGMFSSFPGALVTRNDDPKWSDFINWVVRATFMAEKHGITQSRASELHTTHVFGDQFKNMFINAISVMGNFEEIYARYIESFLPRAGRNLLNNGTSGRILSVPFGSLLADTSPGFGEGGVLEDILLRGHLNCGIIQNATSNGDSTPTDRWAGLAVDYCHAISAAIFQDNINKTSLIFVSEEDAFVSLSRKDVDVIGIASVTLENDVLEPSTGEGFSFTLPVYYKSLNDPLALATREEDVQWSSFVYWIVSATFYAEENNITKRSSEKMPLVNLFGSQHKLMMRNTIKAVGNYGEIYENNIDQLGSRVGLNQLNSGGPQLYAFPGIYD